MKPFALISFLLLSCFGHSQSDGLTAFPLTAVRLLDGPFRAAQQTDLEYILALDADRLLAPFLREAGIEPKAPSYGNWENSGLDGHIGGHYLSALSYMVASTGDERAAQRLDYALGWLDSCQRKSGDGYIGGIPGGRAMWREVGAGNIEAGGFSLNDKWVPLYNIHKLFAGLVDAYTIAGREPAKDLLVKLTDWFYRLAQPLSDQQLQDMLRSEHGGINEALADVAAVTGDDKYLELARRFSHRAILDPLLQERDALNGLHANTQIPKVIGFARIAEMSGDDSWMNAADFFWTTVTQHRSVSIGGNSVREHFHPADDFSSMLESREGPETCNTYNMLKLTRRLFLAQPSAHYLDYYERALYNHILSSQHPDGGFVYFTPMRPRHYRVYSQVHKGFWCCVGSGLENHGKYGEMIYAHRGDELFVNLFIPSTLDWREKGLTLEQRTDFPDSETTQLKLQLKKPRRFSLYFRQPVWLSAPMTIQVNGKALPLKRDDNGYVFVERKWKNGDRVSLQLPMSTQTEFLPDGSPWFSFVRGPIVLAAATDTTDLIGLRADDSRMGHIAAGPLYPAEQAPMIVAEDTSFVQALEAVAGRPMTFSADAILPAAYAGLRLVPFYTLHDARYMLYWRYATPSQYEAIKEELRQAEEVRLALEAQTIDQVAPGQQQPESDHFFKGERTNSGMHRDRHWRTAQGWFSYDLRNPDLAAKTLRLTYFGRDRDRVFDVLVNGELLETVRLTGEGGDRFFDVDYALPSAIATRDKTLTVKFVAHPNSTAGGIFYVRLLR